MILGGMARAVARRSLRSLGSLEQAEALVRERFGFPGLRGGQRTAVATVLEGRDAVVLLPTGGGKSLCYQVPALAAHRANLGTTLVISPLIALMIDQVNALAGRGIRAAALHSQNDDEQEQEALTALARGELTLLYVSPERAAAPAFRQALRRTRLALLAVDEAHCVSQWGHDFRPEYLRLHELRELPALRSAPCVALTATATPKVVEEIAGELRLREPARVCGDFARPNLAFSVQHVPSEATRLAETLAQCQDAGLRGRAGAGRGIVYCSSRDKTEEVAAALASAGFAADCYHAGRAAEARSQVQRAFATGKLRVLVATSAFGMGIDQGDIRLIVHYQAPGSLAAYYQEAGRAGRDGQAARCVLFFSPRDLVLQRRLQDDPGHPRHRHALAALERYARATTCRQQLLCEHFTGTPEHPACGTCDLCIGEAAPSAAPVLAELSAASFELIVAAVGRLERPVGKVKLARALRGSRARGAGELDRLPEHGQLAHHSELEIQAAIEQLLEQRRLVRRGKKYPTVWLAGRPVRRAKAAPAARADRAATARADRAVTARRSDLSHELERFRKVTARRLKWKTYMVFHRKVIAAVDKARPRSLSALARIPGLGPAKIARFGAELLTIVLRHDVQ